MNSKEPWVTHPHIWKSESAYMAFIRGGIRKALWNRYPIKLELLKKKRKRIANPNPKGKAKEVWGGECYLCKQEFVQSGLQVDHIKGNHSLRSMDEVQSFLENMLFITADDIALVCKECHKVKTYAERHKISYDEAVIEKKLIAFTKLSVKKQTEVLTKHNKPCNNQKVRKDSARELLLKGVDLGVK